MLHAMAALSFIKVRERKHNMRTGSRLRVFLGEPIEYELEWRHFAYIKKP